MKQHDYRLISPNSITIHHLANELILNDEGELRLIKEGKELDVKTVNGMYPILLKEGLWTLVNESNIKKIINVSKTYKRANYIKETIGNKLLLQKLGISKQALWKKMQLDRFSDFDMDVIDEVYEMIKE